MSQDSVGSLVISSKAVVTGDPAGDALENENTNVLGNGATCFVSSGAGQGYWQLDKESTATPNGTTVIAPTAGPGRWLKIEGGDSIEGLSVGPNNQLIYTTELTVNNSSIEELSTVYEAPGGTFGRDRLLAIVDGVDETPIEYQLGIGVNGILPQEAVSNIQTSRFISEITITVNRADGSSWASQKWVACWHWVDDTTGYAADTVLEMTDNTDPDRTTLTITVSGDSPATPVFLIGQAATSDQPRYMLDMINTLINPTDVP